MRLLLFIVIVVFLDFSGCVERRRPDPSITHPEDLIYLTNPDDYPWASETLDNLWGSK